MTYPEDQIYSDGRDTLIVKSNSPSKQAISKCFCVCFISFIHSSFYIGLYYFCRQGNSITMLAVAVVVTTWYIVVILAVIAITTALGIVYCKGRMR